eukprot:comp122121_c0_seq1/m.48993 comp122121_c0_seq1/g.48993  ORF comp122121_c0_seq1/g.48993 comp122121_c0_seq1/m.48993 type:complete len:446 (-) comp122121_c0_seq1:75-1412(-)
MASEGVQGKGLSLDPSDFSTSVDRIATWFSHLNDRERQDLFSALIEQTKANVPIISHVYREIEPQLRVDFISRLPDKLAKYIFSFCDARSLCFASQVSKRWRDMANDDTLWHRLCAQHINKKCAKCGWGLPLFTEGIKKRAKVVWKEVYAERQMVELNWRKGHYEMRKLTGHAEGVLCVAFDGHLIVSGGYDKLIKVWNMCTGRCERTLTGHTGSVKCLQFDKARIITGSLDGTVRIWAIETGICVREMEAHKGGVMSLQFDDEHLATAGADACIRVWNFNGGRCSVLRGHTDIINSVRLHNGKLLSASDDYTLRLWDIETQMCLQVYEGHNAEVNCAQMSHNLIVSASMDNTIKVWDASTGQCTHTHFGHTAGVSFVQFDSLRIVSGSQDGVVKVWDLQSGRCIHTIQCHKASVNALQFNDTNIVTGSDDSTIKIWDFSIKTPL